MAAKRKTGGKAKERPVDAKQQSATAETDAKEGSAAPPRTAETKRGLYFLIGVAMILLLVIAFLAFNAWQRNRVVEENTYNGFEFTRVQEGELQLWATMIATGGKTYTIPFYYHPRETEDVSFEKLITRRFTLPENRPEILYLSFDPRGSSTEVIAGVEISRITGSRYDLFNLETRSALQAPSSSETQYPIITCADATPDIAVVTFNQGGFNVVSRDPENPYCIRLEYESANESIRVADRFAYALLGIIPD